MRIIEVVDDETGEVDARFVANDDKPTRKQINAWAKRFEAMGQRINVVLPDRAADLPAYLAEREKEWAEVCGEEEGGS